MVITGILLNLCRRQNMMLDNLLLYNLRCFSSATSNNNINSTNNLNASSNNNIDLNSNATTNNNYNDVTTHNNSNYSNYNNVNRCGILRYIPHRKRDSIINELEDNFNVDRLYELSYGLYSDILIDVNGSQDEVKALTTQFSYKNKDGAYFEVLPIHIENAIKTNFIVKKIYQPQYMLPNVELLFTNAAGPTRYHVRLRHISDFKKVRELERKEVIPEQNYKPSIFLSYFEHSNSGRIEPNLLMLKPSQSSIGSGLRNVNWNQFSVQYNTRILKKTGNFVLLKPNSVEAYNRLMNLNPNSPATPVICSPAFLHRGSKANQSYHVPMDYLVVRSKAHTSVNVVTSSTKEDLSSNEIVTHFLPNKINIVSKSNDEMIIQNEGDDNFNCFYNNSRNSSYLVESALIPIRPHIFSNIIQIPSMLVGKEQWANELEPLVQSSCRFYTKNISYHKFYLKSYETYVDFYVKTLLLKPSEYLSNTRAITLKHMPPHILKALYPWKSNQCFTIQMPHISRKAVRSFFDPIEIQSIYIADALRSSNSSNSFNESGSESGDDLELVTQRETSSGSNDSSKLSTQLINNVAYVKIKNAEDAEKCIYLSGKKKCIVSMHTMWKPTEFDSVPILNEFTIDGISVNVTFGDIRKWLGEVETNTIIRDGTCVRIFLSSCEQIEKLLQRNFTMFDGNFITINQSTIRVNEDLSDMVVHCFVKDNTQDTLDALIDWCGSIGLRGYAKSDHFDNCFLLKLQPYDIKNLLFRSGSKDYLGNEVFLRYAPKRYEKDIIYSSITKRIVETEENTTALGVGSNIPLITQPTGENNTVDENNSVKELNTEQPLKTSDDFIV